MKKTLEYLSLAFFFLMFFISLSPRLPTKNLFQTYIVPTGSMEPFIKTGSLAFVVPTKNLEFGNVIAFPSPKDSYETIIHRIYDISLTGIKTKGDNNEIPDNWIVQKSNVIGKLLFTIPFLGFVSAFLKTRTGFFILIGIPASAILSFHVRDVVEGTFEVFKKRKLPKVSAVIFLLTFLLLSKQTDQVLAKFTSTAAVSGISISMKNDFQTHPGINITITGNGKDSVNHIIYNEENHTIIIQINKAHITNNINFIFTYDSDSGKQGVTGTINLQNLSNLDKTVYLGSCSANNVCNPDKNPKNFKLDLN